MPDGEQQERSMEIPIGSAVITPNMMHAQLLDIGRKVDHLTSSFDPWQQEMRNAVQTNATRIAELAAERKSDMTALGQRIDSEARALELRLRSLEAWRWFLAGIGAIAGPAAAVVTQLILQ